MKTIVLTLLVPLLYTNLFAQYLNIHKNDGSRQNVNLSEIDSITFSGLPCLDIPTVTYEGKIYNTVLIGEQCWLKENLDVGNMISGGNNQTQNGQIEKYCYNNSTTNCNIYGGLYQWGEAMQYSTTPGTQGICPPEWHIPTQEEFEVLESAVGNDGNALKEIGQGSGSGAGTNTSGFSALLAGDRRSNGNFYDLGAFGFFWSSTEESGSAYVMYLGFDYSEIYIDPGPEDRGFSVRCIMD